VSSRLLIALVIVLSVGVGSAAATTPTLPPPIAVPPPAGETAPPPDTVVPSHGWAVCSDWYRTSIYGGRWATDGEWWEYACPLTGMVDQSTPVWTDYYYWDGSGPVYYGEWWTEPYDDWYGEPSCSWWRDPVDTWYGPYACPQETNDHPVAGFTSSCSDLRCAFDATASSDSDGTISSYSWYFGDGSDEVDAVTGEHRFPQSGTYTVSLVVTDQVGLTDRQSQTVTVWGGTPSPAFAVSCTGLRCSFDGSSSSDVGGSIVSYAWQFGDGASSAGLGPTETHLYSRPGTYRVALTVTDDSGETATTARDAVATNAPPTVMFSVDCSSLLCSFDASASADSDGTIRDYAWSFGDGATGAGVVVQRAYAKAGTYSVSLTVTDSGGASAGVSKVVAPITLSARFSKIKSFATVDLAWTGASATNFDVYRNGARLATVQAIAYVDSINKSGAGRYVYQVCAAATNVCSNQATVTL
jgi:PKD repeat protein